jgi:hypothetical protein
MNFYFQVMDRIVKQTDKDEQTDRQIDKDEDDGCWVVCDLDAL